MAQSVNNTDTIHYVSNPIVGANGVIAPYFFVDTPAGNRGVIRSSSYLPTAKATSTPNSQATAGNAPAVSTSNQYFSFCNPA